MGIGELFEFEKTGRFEPEPGNADGLLSATETRRAIPSVLRSLPWVQVTPDTLFVDGERYLLVARGQLCILTKTNNTAGAFLSFTDSSGLVRLFRPGHVTAAVRFDSVSEADRPLFGTAADLRAAVARMFCGVGALSHGAYQEALQRIADDCGRVVDKQFLDEVVALVSELPPALD